MQFDLYKNLNSESKEDFPYLLDIQSETLKNLATRIVIPCAPLSSINKPLDILNPVFEVKGIKIVALFDELSAYPKSMLKEKILEARSLKRMIF